MKRARTWREVAEDLADRAYYAACEQHGNVARQAAADEVLVPDCPFCADIAAYRGYESFRDKHPRHVAD